MPELPEVETVCRTLAPILIGKSFSNFELGWPRTLHRPDPHSFIESIRGREILNVKRRAKLITIPLGQDGMITIHMRMTGELLWLPPNAKTPDRSRAHLRAAFLLGDGSELLFFDTRKFGRIAYFTDDEAEAVDQSFGIEPLEAAFTSQWLLENLARRKRQIKPLLLDQTFIAGLGNIYVDEALFVAGIHPLVRSDTLSESSARALHAAIVDTLAGALSRRGTTLRDYRSGLGEQGENRPTLLIYGSKPGTPCSRCGTPLERLVVGQRGSIFCPACQPMATASGTPSR